MSNYAVLHLYIKYFPQNAVNDQLEPNFSESLIVKLLYVSALRLHCITFLSLIFFFKFRSTVKDLGAPSNQLSHCRAIFKIIYNKIFMSNSYIYIYLNKLILFKVLNLEILND